MYKIKVSRRSQSFPFQRYISFLRRLIGICFWTACSIGAFNRAVGIGKAGNSSEWRSAANQKQIWSYKLKSNLTQTLKTCQISPPRKPLKLFPPTSDHSHLFLPRYIIKFDLTEGIECSDNWFSWRVSHCSVKEKAKFSRVGWL